MLSTQRWLMPGADVCAAGAVALGRLGRVGGRAVPERAAHAARVDIVIASAAAGLCGWLALHTGWIGFVAVVAILGVGALLDRALAGRAPRLLRGVGCRDARP